MGKDIDCLFIRLDFKTKVSVMLNLSYVVSLELCEEYIQFSYASSSTIIRPNEITNFEDVLRKLKTLHIWKAKGGV